MRWEIILNMLVWAMVVRGGDVEGSLFYLIEMRPDEGSERRVSNMIV